MPFDKYEDRIPKGDDGEELPDQFKLWYERHPHHRYGLGNTPSTGFLMVGAFSLVGVLTVFLEKEESWHDTLVTAALSGGVFGLALLSKVLERHFRAKRMARYRGSQRDPLPPNKRRLAAERARASWRRRRRPRR
jgi:hypothetical protein